MEQYIPFIAFVSGFALVFFCDFFVIKSLKNQVEHLKNQGVLEDLEYATTDQLLKEFRSRPDNTYLMMKAIDTKTIQGVKIELNRLTPYDSITMLHLAMNLLTREMKNKGMDVPELPNLFEEDDDGLQAN